MCPLRVGRRGFRKYAYTIELRRRIGLVHLHSIGIDQSALESLHPMKVLGAVRAEQEHLLPLRVEEPETLALPCVLLFRV